MLPKEQQSHVLSHIGVTAPWQGVTMTAIRGSRQALSRGANASRKDSESLSRTSTKSDMQDGNSYVENFTQNSWSRASCTSRLFLFWMFPILWRGSKKTLNIDDFPISLVPNQFQPKALSGIVKATIKRQRNKKASYENKNCLVKEQRKNHISGNCGRWSAGGKLWIVDPDNGIEIKTRKKRSENFSILMQLVRIFWRPVLRSNVLYILTTGIQVSLPLLMKSVLSAITEPYDVRKAYTNATMLLVFAIASALLANHANLTTTLIGVNMQTSLMSLVMEKVLHTKRSSLIYTRSGDKTQLRARNEIKGDGQSGSDSEASQSFASGDVLNLISNDTQRVQEFFVVAFHWMSPFLIVVTLILLYSIIGVASFAGFGVLFLSLTLVGMLAREIGRLRKKQMTLTDRRITAVSDALIGIKALKLYNWETQFINHIDKIRSEETTYLRRMNYVQAFAASFLGMTPVIVALVTFAVYSSLGNLITSDTVFPAMALFNFLQIPLAALPMFVGSLIQVAVADRRLSAFLSISDGDCEAMRNDYQHTKKPPMGSVSIQGNFSWECDSTLVGQHNKANADPRHNREIDVAGTCTIAQGLSASGQRVCLRNISLGVQKRNFKADKLAGKSIHQNLSGKLVVITGSTASGKSSLLAALLGELQSVKIPTEEQDSNCLVSLVGRVAYVGHESIILNSSIRDNIVFGSSFDAMKYARVIHATCLDRDFREMVDGDMTEIGERGINVSGGQKQRISLARAMYSSSDIYLFDDPLSALDKKVATHIFEEGIIKLLGKKTRLLVSGNPECLLASDVVVVMKDGEMILNEDTTKVFAPERFYDIDSSTSEAMEKSGVNIMHKRERDFAIRLCNSEIVESEKHFDVEVLESRNNRNDHNHIGRDASKASININLPPPNYLKMSPSLASTASTTTSTRTRTTDDEMIASGRVQVSTYCHYMRKGAPIPVWFIITIMFVAVEVGNFLFSWWFTRWTDKVEINILAGEDVDQINSKRYLVVAGIIVLLTTITGFCRTFTIAHVTTNASCRLHKRLLHAVFVAPLSFFHKTPAGRILNRFTRDTDQIDMTLPNVGHGFLFSLFACLSVFVAISIFIPTFIAIAVPICCCYIVVAIFYSCSFREIVRIEALARSPLFSLLSTVLSSPQTIRAYGKESYFIAKFNELIQQRQLMEILKPVCNCWLGISLELFSSIVVGFASIACVYYRNQLDVGVAGIIMTYSLGLSSSLSVLMRSATGTEASMNSVERVYEYGCELSSEFKGDYNGDDTANNLEIQDGQGKRHGRGRHSMDTHCQELQMLPPPLNLFSKLNSAHSLPVGNLKFENFFMRYREDLPHVLKDLNINIEAGSNVVVIGRYSILTLFVSCIRYYKTLLNTLHEKSS